MRKTRLMSVVAAVLTALANLSVGCAEVAHAEEWHPTKTLNILMPADAGAGHDLVFAPIRKALDALHIPYMIEHVPGVDGVLGTNRFKRTALPDGHDLLIYGAGQYVGADIDHPDVKTWAWNDFEPVTLIAQTPAALLANPNSKAATIAEVIEELSSGPKVIGSPGTLLKLSWDLLARKTHVPPANLRFDKYRGPGPLLINLMIGELEYGVAPLPVALSLYQDKKIRILAITSRNRLAGLPDVPTVAETVEGYEVGLDWGIVLPKGVAPEVVRYYAKLMKRILLSSDTQDYFKANSLYIDERDIGPDAYRAHMEAARKQLLEQRQ